jgi:hypothetical protein
MTDLTTQQGWLPDSMGGSNTPTAPSDPSSADDYWKGLSDLDKQQMMQAHQGGLLNLFANRAIHPMAQQAMIKAIAAQQQQADASRIWSNPAALGGQTFQPGVTGYQPMSNGPYIQNMGGMPRGYSNQVAQAQAIQALIANSINQYRRGAGQQGYANALQGLDPQTLQQMLGMMTLFRGTQ